MTKTINGLFDGLRPAKRLNVSEWADEHRFLSSVAAAEPGRWRTSRTPYLREIMDCFDPYSEVEEVIFMKGAQIGATECGYNVLGYYIDIDPCPIMMVMPTVETAKRNSKMRFDPMIKASPRLEQKISTAKSRDSGNTIMQKDFPGGTVILSGANSASSLRSVPIRILLLDEVDAFPLDLDNEGSPVELAKARTRTFASRKIFQLSTPTLEDTSQVYKEFKTSDQRYFHVPCPHCGAMQPLEWNNVKFDKTAKPIKEATYECCECGESIDERFKTQMLANGQWYATKEENLSNKRVGYHLNSLYSPLGWYSWVDAANQFMTAKRENDQHKLKVFVNTVLGEPWKEKVLVPEYKRLFERKGGYQSRQVPSAVCLITCGVDVQDDRLELEIVGWGKGLRSWSIDYRVLGGKTNESYVWSQLNEVLNEVFEREDGASIGIYKMCIDSGYNTNHVYNFCRTQSAARVVPVKGQPGSRQRVMLRPPTSVDVMSNGKKTGTTMLWNLGVDVIKTEIYGALNLDVMEDGSNPPFYCAFPSDYDISFFRMITAERQITRTNSKGYIEYVWQKDQARNEALDCRVYARAAAAIAGVDRWNDNNWQAVSSKTFVPESNRTIRQVQPVKKRKPRTSIW